MLELPDTSNHMKVVCRTFGKELRCLYLCPSHTFDSVRLRILPVDRHVTWRFYIRMIYSTNSLLEWNIKMDAFSRVLYISNVLNERSHFMIFYA